MSDNRALPYISQHRDGSLFAFLEVGGQIRIVCATGVEWDGIWGIDDLDCLPIWGWEDIPGSSPARVRRVLVRERSCDG